MVWAPTSKVLHFRPLYASNCFSGSLNCFVWAEIADNLLNFPYSYNLCGHKRPNSSAKGQTPTLPNAVPLQNGQKDFLQGKSAHIAEAFGLKIINSKLFAPKSSTIIKLSNKNRHAKKVMSTFIYNFTIMVSFFNQNPRDTLVLHHEYLHNASRTAHRKYPYTPDKTIHHFS